MDYNIYLKCDNLQYTGSCVERGIRNAFVAKNEVMSQRGVLVPSNGNTALGAAYHGGSLGIPVTVILPDRTPPSLTHRCADLGADVVLFGETLEDVINYAKKANRDENQTLLSSDDPLILAGLGSLGVEIITQLPETDAVIVPVAAGGLLAATLVACKKLKCTCLVYGAECAKVPKMMKPLQAGHPISVPVVPNLAQGLNASIVGQNAFATIKGRLDRMLTVDESYIARAVINILERERLVADGAGVCALAAVMQGLVPELRGRRAVCVISGGNIDPARLTQTIQRGLGVSGRLMRFGVALPDNCHGDVGTTWANVVVETANEEHASTFKDRLREQYPSIRFAIADIDDKHKVTIR
ncbi:unnamed protein product, partial [Brenthis ino]